MQLKSKYDSHALKNFVIVNARERKGLTLEQASEMIGVGKTNYMKYELLKSYPSRKHRAKICRLYGLNEKTAFPEWIKCLIPGKKRDEKEELSPKNNILEEKCDKNKELFLKKMVIPFSYVDEECFPVHDIQKEAENTIFCKEIIGRLDEKSRRVMEMRFGLNEYYCVHSLDDVGEEMGFSRQHISKIEKKALKLLRAKIGQVL
ncbi:MAG: sigma factor-like helix-turn-helix DNA-binding protein [Candidatus Paceibacterota bacterium]